MTHTHDLAGTGASVAFSGSTSNNGAHSHSRRMRSWRAGYDGGKCDYYIPTWETGDDAVHTETISVSENGIHQHSFSGKCSLEGTVSDFSGNTGSVGQNTAITFDILPTYLPIRYFITLGQSLVIPDDTDTLMVETTSPTVYAGGATVQSATAQTNDANE